MSTPTLELPSRAAASDRCRRLHEARLQTDKLFSVVREPFLFERPIQERHRLIFYLGHVDTFDWNHIARGNLSPPSQNPVFDRLFEAGIDPDSDELPKDTAKDWPSVREVQEYVRLLRARIDELIEHADADRVERAIEHRLMHAETLAFLLHSMPYSQKSAPACGPAPLCHSNANIMVEIPAGTATLGLRRGAGFGWDNEFEQNTVPVNAFAVARYKVTNGEYLRFVENGAPPPAFWVWQRNRWFLRGMFACLPLPLDWPVYVTLNEATAFARQSGCRVMTEPEFHRAAYGSGHNTSAAPERLYPWGDIEPALNYGNFDFHRWDPMPIGATPAGDSAFSVSQLVGNGWEWTSTVFHPFPGFEPTPDYPGYSANFFEGNHYVLKGGSPRTAAQLLRRSFRNWFRPNYPYVYSTFRLAQ